MITEVSAVALRQNLGDMLNRVQYRRDSILIKKDGKPVAALVDAALFERIRAMQERFDALCERLARSHEGVPANEGVAEIERVSVLARADTAEAWRSEGRLPGVTRAQAPRLRAAASKIPKSSRPKVGGKTSGR